MEELIKDIKSVCLDYMSIVISDEQAVNILENNPSILEYGAYDTEERSNILYFVCLDICNMRVPMYKDTDEYCELFNKLLVANATSKGYGLTDYWN